MSLHVHEGWQAELANAAHETVQRQGLRVLHQRPESQGEGAGAEPGGLSPVLLGAPPQASEDRGQRGALVGGRHARLLQFQAPGQPDQRVCEPAEQRGVFQGRA